MSAAPKRALRAGLLLAVVLVVSFGVVSPPERCPTVSAGQVRQAAQATVDWFARNQNPDGSWLYLYNAKTDTVADEYEEVRHAGAAMGLYQAASNGLPRALATADRGTQWALDRLWEHDDWAAVSTHREIATGATALLVAGLDVRRRATGDTRYDEQMRRMGRFLVSQVEPSGAVLGFYDTQREAPVPRSYSKYFTGETYWALARLHETFPDEGWGRVADRISAYLATRRDKEEGHWPPIPDHWAEYGLDETTKYRPLTAAEVRYARRQAELWGGQARWVQQRFGPWGALVRGPEVFRGGWYGVMDEGFTGLWRIARADPRLSDLVGPVGERARCIAGIAVKEQASAADAARAKNPSRVQGAWFFNDGETRMDDQQHTLAALVRAIPIFEAGGGATDVPPSAWLFVAALLLALNPARGVFGVPRRDAGRLAVVGGAIGAVAVVLLALAGGALPDISGPGFRTAAGFVAILTGAADLILRPPRPEPSLPGRRAALVPVAIPVVVRPALVLIALAAQDALLTAVVLAVGVALLGGVAARWVPEGVDGRVLRWAARLLAAGLVVCGVLLSIDGILAV